MADDEREYDPERARAAFEIDALTAIVYAILWRQPAETIRGVARDMRDFSRAYEDAARHEQTDPARDKAAVYFETATHIEEMAKAVIADRAKGEADNPYPEPA